jgi:hypothetical protein
VNPNIVALLIALMIPLTVYRVSRLIALDAFPPVAIPRDWVLRKLGDDHWFSYLITCMWCVSVYVSAGVVLVADRFVSVPLPWLLWPTASAVTGYMAVHEPEE